MSACVNASKKMGLQLGEIGKDFAGDYSIKGCHASDGVAFFGIEGKSIGHRTSLVKPNYRPNGYDCGTLVIEIIFNFQ